MNRLFAACVIIAIAAPAFAEDKPKPNTLTPKEIADGWIMLFDGETTFGWKIEGDVKVQDRNLILNGDKMGTIESLIQFTTPVELIAEWKRKGGTTGGAFGLSGGFASDIQSNEWTELRVVYTPSDSLDKLETQTRKPGGEWKRGTKFSGKRSVRSVYGFALPGSIALFRSIKIRPVQTTPLFTGKNLNGWKVNAVDPKRMASKFEVTKDGELSVKNGPGDLVTEKEFDNFVLQFDCKTLGEALNSGIFFRCIPGQYQNGYEAQVQNAYLNNDRAKPADFGTGAIYRRVPARKVVSNDNEWFTMTVVASGKHIATWVNGYQTVDWTDDRKANDNPRQGYRAAKGPLSIQGHDKTTDLLFKNIRIVELPK